MTRLEIIQQLGRCLKKKTLSRLLDEEMFKKKNKTEGELELTFWTGQSRGAGRYLCDVTRQSTLSRVCILYIGYIAI